MVGAILKQLSAGQFLSVAACHALLHRFTIVLPWGTRCLRVVLLHVIIERGWLLHPVGRATVKQNSNIVDLEDVGKGRCRR
jgi:hypothetical protein